MKHKYSSHIDMKILMKKLKQDDIFALASQLSYSLLLSFFPFLIFLMTIMGSSNISSRDMLFFLKSIIPHTAYTMIYTTVVEIFDSKKTNLLSFSLIMTIIVASNGFHAVIRGLNKAYYDYEKRSFFKIRIISIFCTFVLVVLIIFSIILLVLGNILSYKITQYFNFPNFYNLVFIILRYTVTFIAMTFFFAFIYKLTPSRTLSFRSVLPGALFTSIGWIICSMCFAFYVNNFNNYSKTYGSIGAVIVLMVWLFLTSVIILIGGEINGLIAKSPKR